MPTQGTASRFVRLAAQATAKAAPDEDIERCLSLAVHLANEYKGRGRSVGLDWEDLQGVACLALVEAAKSYPDSEACAGGVAFDAYASVVIRTQLVEAIRSATPARITSKAWKYIAELKEAQRKRRRGERSATDEELAEELGWEVDRVRFYLRVADAAQEHFFFDAPAQDEDGENVLINTIADPNADHAEATLERMDRETQRQWLTQAIGELPRLTRYGVSLMFGLPAPGAETMAVNDVARIASNMANVGKGLTTLREQRQHDHKDMPEVVQGRAGSPYSGARAPGAITGKEGQRRAIDIWRRYSSGPEAPPVFAKLT